MGEVEWVQRAILVEVFQGDEAKRGLAEHIARVAVRAHHRWGDAPLDTLVSHGVE